jgi:hypothetical protein
MSLHNLNPRLTNCLRLSFFAISHSVLEQHSPLFYLKSFNNIAHLFGDYCYCSVYKWYRTRCPIHRDHYWSIVVPHLRNNHSRFTHHSSLAVTADTPSSKAWETWWEMSVNLAYKSLFHTAEIFNMP